MGDYDKYLRILKFNSIQLEWSKVYHHFRNEFTFSLGISCYDWIRKGKRKTRKWVGTRRIYKLKCLIYTANFHWLSEEIVEDTLVLGHVQIDKHIWRRHSEDILGRSLTWGKGWETQESNNQSERYDKTKWIGPCIIWSIWKHQ
jgi:hypothetical protein